MQNDMNSIAQHLFQKEDVNDVTDNDLTDFISRYPYVGPARYLLARKRYDPHAAHASDELITAGLYFNNPLWLNTRLTGDLFAQKIEAPAEAKEDVAQLDETVYDTPVLETQVEEPLQNALVEEMPAQEQSVQETQLKEQPVQEQPVQEQTAPGKPAEETEIVFQSYHTIDYFASQGIRLQQTEFTKDRLGQQLKSFTEWLKSMKKLPNAEGHVAGPEEESRQQAVMQTAANSIQEKEVLTEAMAEVWIKQGHNGKAIEIYNKLSLQNPSKSGYFAAKIEQLK